MVENNSMSWIYWVILLVLVFLFCILWKREEVLELIHNMLPGKGKRNNREDKIREYFRESFEDSLNDKVNVPSSNPKLSAVIARYWRLHKEICPVNFNFDRDTHSLKTEEENLDIILGKELSNVLEQWFGISLPFISYRFYEIRPMLNAIEQRLEEDCYID